MLDQPEFESYYGRAATREWALAKLVGAKQAAVNNSPTAFAVQVLRRTKKWGFAPTTKSTAKPHQNYVQKPTSFFPSVQAYLDHSQQPRSKPRKQLKQSSAKENENYDLRLDLTPLEASRPQSCVQCGYQRALVKHTPYPRTILLFCLTIHVLVPCFRCKHSCGKIVSFLPEIAIPYKHFGSEVIGDALHCIVGTGMTISDYFTTRNEAGVESRTLRRWIKQFNDNCLVLRTDALPRLSVLPVPAESSDHPSPAVNEHTTTLYATLRRAFPFLGTERGTPTLLGSLQTAISKAFPPLGVFRPRLLPVYSSA